MDTTRNRTFDELRIRDSASPAPTLTRKDIELFAGGLRLHAPDSAVAVWCLPADEEAVIARQTRTVAGAGSRRDRGS